MGPRLWAGAAIAALVAIAALAVVEIRRTTSGMAPTSMSAAELRGLLSGGAATIVVKVTEDDGARLTGRLLANRGGAFAEAGQDVQIDLDAETQIVMGGASDVRPGAVIEVDGVRNPDGRLRARKVIILTGFVKLAPKSSGS